MGKMIKKKKIAALVLAGTMAMGSSMQAFACMGVYVGKEVSENGSSYIGRSEDIGVGRGIVRRDCGKIRFGGM